MPAPVTYWPDFSTGLGDLDTIFETLLTELEWERRPGAPRSEFYANDTPAPYTYGTGEHARTYLPRPWHPLMLTIRHQLEDRLGCDMDVCFLNLYRGPRDWLGWHSDDSPEMDPARPIATISYGAERAIEFRPIDDRVAAPESLTLTNGSAAIMAAGMQQTWQHRIPKSGAVVGPRISLTFRGFVDLGPQVSRK